MSVNFSSGICLYYSSNNTLTNNTALNAGYGILLFVSRNNTLTGNTASNNDYGISLTSYTAPDNNTLTGNTASNNHWGIVLAPSNNNTLTSNTTSNNRLGGIYLENSSNNTLTSNIASNNLWDGFSLGGGWNNILTGNTALNNSSGIALYSSSYNALTDNTASNNSSGIRLYYSSYNALTDNTASNNSPGIQLYYSSNNQIYKNNFISNTTQAFVYAGSGNIFNLEKPTGGNYWSDFDTPVEGCYDTNSDGFCDTPYRFYDGVDYLPWTRQSGWETPADTTPPTTTVTLSGTLGSNDWYVSNVQVTFTVADNEGGSGIKKTEYSFDGTTWNTYSVPFTISNEGATAVYYKSTDNVGNVETAKSISVKIDKTSPTITATINPNPNANGWNSTDVTVSFICDDSISGIASCPSPITVTTEGAGQVITGTSVDKAGNTATTSVTLNIDKTPPVANISANPGFLWPPNHKMVDVAINGGASDSISQVASIVFTVTDEYGGTVQPIVSGFNTIIPLEAWREGTDRDGRVYTITVVVTDMAGNQSTAITEVIVPHDMRK